MFLAEQNITTDLVGLSLITDYAGKSDVKSLGERFLLFWCGGSARCRNVFLVQEILDLIAPIVVNELNKQAINPTTSTFYVDS